MKHLCFLLLAAILLSSACSTKYYLVRHAERLNDSSNSPLSAVGFARAEILRDSLLNKDIDYVFSSTYLRTRQTAQPLATALGKQLKLYRPDTLGGLVTRLKKIRGKKVLIVGHSDTTPTVVEGLSGQTVTIGHDDYDNLFIVKISYGLGSIKKRLTKTTFGPVSP